MLVHPPPVQDYAGPRLSIHQRSSISPRSAVRARLRTPWWICPTCYAPLDHHGSQCHEQGVTDES
jgi:hypothetical protein